MSAVSSQDLPHPIPARASKKVIQGATEAYAQKEGLQPGFVIEALVHKLGGRIVYGVPSGISRANEAIRVFADGDFVIYLPTETSPLRDRFTIAHELGHYLIHYPLVQQAHGADSGMIATRYVDDSNDDLRRAEWEANWFAAALLMPEGVFIDQWTSHPDSQLVASYFYVTTPAAEVRAKSLGLIRT